MSTKAILPKNRAIQLNLSPVNNKQLANLCGALDENLHQIESALDVSIARRGEHFTLRGETAQTARASEALQKFYAQAKDHLSVDEIQLGLIELLNRPVRAIAATAGVMPTLLTRKTELHGRTPRQIEYLKYIQEHDITFGTGPAGTGKTYLAVASAVDAFERELVQRIVLTRPAVEAGERLGFLPGDLAQKVDPYLRPLYDALYDLMGFERVTKLFERGSIEIAPLAYMRGRTLNHAFIILDEAQNTTPEQMKMFLTRIGIGAKAVVTGDVTQIDLQRGQKSGLIEAREILKDVRGIAFTEFLKEDVVRHPLVARIVTAYEAHTAALEAKELARKAMRNSHQSGVHGVDNHAEH
jgi:phosphate starvation-inducible PhoH-like protein